MSEESRAIVTEVDDAIAVIRFNRPQERNPLSFQTLQELETTLLELILRGDVSAIIFTGTDDVFASGANIRELAQLDSTSALVFSRLGQRILRSIANARQITIAAINGHCMGGALDLALACDVRVASHNAVFAHPGAKLGIITGWGGTQRLPAIVGRAKALEFFATARQYKSEDAVEIGLITSVAYPVLSKALEIARQYAKTGAEIKPGAC